MPAAQGPGQAPAAVVARSPARMFRRAKNSCNSSHNSMSSSTSRIDSAHLSVLCPLLQAPSGSRAVPHRIVLIDREKPLGRLDLASCACHLNVLYSCRSRSRRARWVPHIVRLRWPDLYQCRLSGLHASREPQPGGG